MKNHNTVSSTNKLVQSIVEKLGDIGLPIAKDLADELISKNITNNEVRKTVGWTYNGATPKKINARLRNLCYLLQRTKESTEFAIDLPYSYEVELGPDAFSDLVVSDEAWTLREVVFGWME